MRPEVSRILQLVVAVLVIAVMWGVATLQQTDPRARSNPMAIHPVRIEKSNA